MATRVQLQNGDVIDLDAIGYMSPLDKLDVIQAVLERMDADDADRGEADTGFCIDKIQRILDISTPPN